MFTCGWTHKIFFEFNSTLYPYISPFEFELTTYHPVRQKALIQLCILIISPFKFELKAYHPMRQKFIYRYMGDSRHIISNTHIE